MPNLSTIITGQSNTVFALPLSRNTDPTTSYEAEHHYKTSGRHITHIQQILQRLSVGPASARELSSIALKYSGRISDLRALGHKIEYVGSEKLYYLRPSQGELGL